MHDALPTHPNTMEMLDPMIAGAAVGGLVLLLFTLWWVRRPAPATAVVRDDSFDTVQAWPPQAVRVMTVGERQAFEVLRRALPGYVILAQVPLSRFISVPTRNPYHLWLQRAGRLAVDLLVCDYSSRAVAAVQVRTTDETARAVKRHQRLIDILRAAGLTVHEWDDGDLPSVNDVRELFVPKTSAKEAPPKVDAVGRKLIPVADIREVLADGDATDYGQLEPVPSAFYDDIEESRAARAVA
jgi:hypothetical protein